MANSPTTTGAAPTPRKRKEKTTFEVFESILEQFSTLGNHNDRLYLLDKMTEVHERLAVMEGTPAAPSPAPTEGS